MKSSEIRRQFIDYFVQKQGHTFVPSSPVVPLDDPTLLFTNAGMNQFKPIFLGTETRPYKRVVNSQKCIRAGGKHNDLEDVGRSRRHHTFFEMLGNWSFGDYFKREAITWAWDLLVNQWKLDPSRLHVTCFEGDEKSNIPRDTESARLWKQITNLPDDHIHFFGKDNFWEMGETGPCGPCTEIHIDRTPDKSGGKLVNGPDPRVMEIWNLVFIEYNRNADRSLVSLPAKHVDTGMGFERISQVLQDKDSTYAIDLFDPYWRALEQMSGRKYAGTFPKTNAPDPAAEAASPQLRTDIAFRVIADHIRCLTFAMTDGAMPSNEGRGYVLRRILRRAVRFGRQQLELREPFLHKLVPVVVESMGEAFPELNKNADHVAQITRDEEIGFGKTLDRGIEYWWMTAGNAYRSARFTTSNPGETRNVLIEQAKHSAEGESYLLMRPDSQVRIRLVTDVSTTDVWYGSWRDIPPNVILETTYRSPMIAADDAFKLHDTYGFPIDLTQMMAAERGMSVDVEGYEKLMEQAREKARAGGRPGDSPVYELPAIVLAELGKTGVKPTDDAAKYESSPIEARVMAIWNGSNLDPSAEISEDQEVAIILDRTSFYAEAGGQVGDAGVLESPSPRIPGEGRGEGLFDVETTRAVAGFVMHIGRVRSDRIRVGDPVTATVSDRRAPTMQNHTGTHLLNWALREVLGDGVQQKGSLVAPDRLRFDFSHGKSMTDDEIARVERLVNQSIQKNLPVYAQVVPQEKALKIAGLRAVFGEKYPTMVRVVSIGAPVASLLEDPSNPKWREFSIEFCGGTHLANSSEVADLVITAEESVSKGVRRIVALTGESASAAALLARDLHHLLKRARSLAESELREVLESINQQLNLENLPLLAKRQAQSIATELAAKLRAWEKSRKTTAARIDVAAIASELLASGNIVVARIEGASDEQLRRVIDSIKMQSPGFAALLAAVDGDKINIVAAVSDDLIKRGLRAGDWVRAVSKVAGGGGGGRPQMAQAGAKDVSKLEAALAEARSFAHNAVKET